MRRFLTALLLVSSAALAQETTTQAPATTATTAANTTSTMVLESDSHETRQQFQEILRRLPPEVGKVLKLDPTLWNNEKYLANYPALSAFIAAHPDVVHSPSFYLEDVWIPRDAPPETPGFRIWNQILETIAIFGGFSIAGFVLMWVIRTVIDHRRWSRLTKTQAEAHTKLLDRFGSNEELLNYIQTPAGRSFLESAPIAVEAPPARPVSAPIGRILWSVQAGLVTLAAGIGMRIVSWSVSKDAAEPFSALGALAIAIGIGLVVSSGASFLISRRLGLWHDPLSTDTVGQ
ncbi:MAG TPA: hypothetical protein VJZ00_06240 [Thermoanaerobaculia bacterium]|nr:hypothetical protein [Thermoanaerobaculia bacterium]